MNLATGFPCPACGHDRTDVLRLELNEIGHPVSIRLHCTSCERVFLETIHVDEPMPARRGAG